MVGGGGGERSRGGAEGRRDRAIERKETRPARVIFLSACRCPRRPFPLPCPALPCPARPLLPPSRARIMNYYCAGPGGGGGGGGLLSRGRQLSGSTQYNLLWII